MMKEEIKFTAPYDNYSKQRPDSYYNRLLFRLVFMTAACSIVPLLFVGWGINLHYTKFAKSRLINSIETQLADHRKIIELFLRERISRLNLIAGTHASAYLGERQNLENIFEVLNQNNGSFTDLGVIRDLGSHLAYTGPYDLINKNYADTLWFNEVMEKGIYISDVFMGFRKVPHFVIAVLRIEDGQKWILRATINSELFNSLVQSMQVGKSGEIILLNHEGVFQATPKFSGRIMGKAPFPVDSHFEGVKITSPYTELDDKTPDSRRQIVAQTWLNEPRWLLMIRQDYDEAIDEVNHANKLTLIFLHISAFVILIVTILMTYHMVRVIKKRDMEVEDLNNQIMEAGKLASIGELSAGVAHEINNPLAIILTEKQILLDLADETPSLNEDFKKRFLDSLSQITEQVKRCKKITQNLLKFSRRTSSVIEAVDLNGLISEVIDLMEREVGTKGIRFISEPEKGLAPLVTDPSQLQQVFLNLINNAVDAHQGKPCGSIRISTRYDTGKNRIEIELEDTGSGIPPDKLNRIFDPFYTTKPVGKGTGLGLSISYGIIQRLGGDITVRSKVDEGTLFTISLPVDPLQKAGKIT
ncbi:MAG: two-component sensor histidine kinase [Deltaproteobacteria bacterium]|nr:two-component sensor histidine kinase [Deltaproteobacteria bacterium]